MSNFKPPMILPKLSSLKWLQGSATELTHELHLMVMIQPNCPGCHIHALPLANQLASVKQDFDIYCVSTAFEDFEFNNEDTARLLLEGKHVGVSKEQLGETARNVPKMPLAHDIVIPIGEASDEVKTMALEASKANALIQMEGRVPITVLKQHLQNVGYEVLPEKIPMMFYKAQAMGTPTWVLHQADGTVLGTKFGQLSKFELGQWLKDLGGVDVTF